MWAGSRQRLGQVERRAQEVGVRETAGWGPGGHSQCGLEGAEEDESCCRLAGESPCGLGGWGGWDHSPTSAQLSVPLLPKGYVAHTRYMPSIWGARDMGSPLAPSFYCQAVFLSPLRLTTFLTSSSCSLWDYFPLLSLLGSLAIARCYNFHFLKMRKLRSQASSLLRMHRLFSENPNSVE